MINLLHYFYGVSFLSVKLRLLLQMHLSVIFLLSIIALSSTAPTTTTVDHELAAKQFFGSLFEKIKNQKFDEGQFIII